jgi:hypothetical protein
MPRSRRSSDPLDVKARFSEEPGEITISKLIRVMASLTVVALLALWVITVASPVSADPDSDQYLAERDHNGVQYQSRDKAVLLGRQTCEGFREGMSVSDIREAMRSSGFDPHAGAVVLTASLDAFCPEFWPMVNRYIDSNPSAYHRTG